MFDPRASRIVHEGERPAGFQRELHHIGHLGAMHFPSSATRNREILTDKMHGAQPVTTPSAGTSLPALPNNVALCLAKMPTS